MEKPRKTSLKFNVKELSYRLPDDYKDPLPASIKKSLAKFKEEENWYNELICFTIFIVLQIVVSTGHYSGFAKPPMFGDFEAQRHWMEITTNLPIYDWYANTTENDLNYWGLDYPPLSAYHSWLFGKFSEWIEPRWTSLFLSRGVEDSSHKLFMRLTVIVTMSLFYLPAVLSLFRQNASTVSNSKLFQFFAALCYPGLIFVDNGHFQYNHIALALFLWSVYYLERSRFFIGAILFVLALNFKQMELYHALPIFVFLLSRSLSTKGSFLQQTLTSFLNVAKLGIIVVFMFAVLWAPFLSDLALVSAVFRRLFPISRGVFEDKVANFWCCLSVIVKVKTNYSKNFLAFVSAGIVLLTTLPSLLLLLWRSSQRNFRLCLVISSLSFYLFSFQVHEKTILQVAIPTFLLLEEMPQTTHWFLSVSLFSLYPLCIKDEMPEILPLFITYHFYLSFIVKKTKKQPDSWWVWCAKTLLLAIAVTLCFLMLFAPAPQRYPHLFTLMVAAFSFANFAAFFAYANFYLFKTNRQKLVIINAKKNN